MAAVLAAPQPALAGGTPRASGSGTSPVAANSAAPDAPSAQASANPSSGTDATAAVPHLIKFSGILQNLSGKPIAGPVDVTFSLYADESGGTPLWFETQTVQADALGNYTVLLGAMSPSGIPPALFTSADAHWLGVQVANLPEQSRVLLVSVPYALKSGDAETLGGKPASAFMLASQAGADAAAGAAATSGTLSGVTNKGSAKTAPSSQTPITQTATQNFIPMYSDNLGNLTNSVMTQSGARIGINTSTPAFGLDLNSNIFAIGPKAALPGGGGTMRFRDDTGTVRWLFGMPGVAGSQDFFMYNYTNGHTPLYIENAAPSYSFYFAGNGDVGIGTNTPTFSLDINRAFVAIGPKTLTSGIGGSLRFRNGSGTVQWSIGIPNIASSSDFFVYNNVSGQQPLFISSGAISNSLYLASGGVGIGTTTPSAKLEVNGTAKFDQAVTFTQPVTFPSSQNFGSTATVLTASTAALSANNSTQVLSVTQAGTGTVAVFNNTTGGKILSGLNNGVEKFAVSGAGDVTIQGKFTGDGSGLTNIGPSSIKTGLSYDISVTSASSADSAASALSADFASQADFATNAGGAGTFAGHQLPDFPLLADANIYENTQTVDSGDLVVNTGKLSVGTGNLILGSGQIGIGTESPGKAVDVVGDIRVTGCFLVNATTIGGTCSSDRRLKTNIRPFDNVLDKVANLQPVRFNWRVNEFPQYHFANGESYGLIAQKVEKVFPAMVSTDKRGYKQVDYSELPFLMLESIRELKTRNDSLQETVRSQQGQLEQTHAALAKLGQASAEKDAKISSLEAQVEGLRKAQIELASIEKRLAVLEAKGETQRSDKRVASASAHKKGKNYTTEVAQAGF